MYLGTLRVSATLEDIHARLWSRVLVILATQAAKTFLIALFVFQRLVTQHLSSRADYTRGLDTAHLGVTPRAGSVLLVVRDQGLGMSESEKHRIFDRFSRGVSEQHYGGLGLGLYLARHLVEAHGGSISVESRPGEGSTFTVELPVEEEAAAGGSGAPG